MSLIDSMLKKPVKKPEISEKQKQEKRLKKNPLVKNKANVSLKDGKDRYWLILESMTSGLEKYYFLLLRILREQPAHGVGCDEIIKVKDIFDASVTSSFHGHVGAKISAMQQQAAQHLATLGGMVKTVLPIINELRKTDERLDYYEKSLQGDESAEIALKSIWIELVEGGMQNPNSVYALATKVGFLTLPDLFFKINPKEGIDGVDTVIKSLKKEGIPSRVADVCAKKLFAYYEWKKQTYKELKFTREFKIKYLKQHYNSIKMYMRWVRPYLKTISNLQMKGNYSDADLVNAFETSKIEIELLGVYRKGFSKHFPVIQIKFLYVSRPELIYTPQGQKQPVHAGRTEVEIRPYVVTQEEINDYMKSQEIEDLELLASMNESMMALKDDLKKYLGELGEDFGKKEEAPKARPKQKISDLFKPLGSGVVELFSAFGSLKLSNKKLKKEIMAKTQEKGKAKKKAKSMGRLTYYVYKKSLKLYTEI